MLAVRSHFDLPLHFNNNSIRAEGNKYISTSNHGSQGENETAARAGKTRVFKVVARDFKVEISPTQLFLDTSPVIANTQIVNF